MSNTVHVFDFLEQNNESVEGLCAIFGSERFLKRLAAKHAESMVAGGDPEFSSTVLDGDSATLADVLDEVSTRSLFGGDGPRIVVVDHADGFVKKFRDRLEDLAKNPFKNALLVLIVDSWASNTRLYKAINKNGFQIQCDEPIIKRGRSKQRDEKKLIDWLTTRAANTHGFELKSAGAQVLIELTQCDFGRMDQELAKLSLYADEGKLDPATITKIVGGWATRDMWQAVDAAVDGNASGAIQLIGQLIKAGQHPLALFGQLSWSLRRYAEAAEVVARQKRNGRVDMEVALKQAGFRPWGGEIDKAGKRLRQLGRARAFKLYDWILEADIALKRSHSKEHRGRLVLEKLFVKMAKELGPQPVN